MSEILHPLVYEDDTVQVFIEKHPHYGAIIHVYSLKWSKGVLNHYFEVLVDLQQALTDVGVTKLHAMIKDEKLFRFASLFGFVSTGEYIKDSEGVERLVMKCEL